MREPPEKHSGSSTNENPYKKYFERMKNSMENYKYILNNIVFLTTALLITFSMIICSKNNTNKNLSVTESHTNISIINGKWHINGKITYPGSRAEGLLMNVRMVNSIFEDLHIKDFLPEVNTDEFISSLNDYIQHGIRAFTVCLQGGYPGYEGARNSAYNSDGSLRAGYMSRAERVIRACDSAGAAVILSCFYQRQDQFLNDEKAVKNALTNTIDWLKAKGFTNVLLEVANEYRHPGYDHTIIKEEKGEVELIRLAKERYPQLLVSTSGMGNGIMASEISEEADFIVIHFNSTPLEEIPGTIRNLQKYNKPIVCNEDDKNSEEEYVNAIELSVLNSCSYGLMLVIGRNKWHPNQHAPFIFRGYQDSKPIYDKFKEVTTAK